jgi:ribonuclease HI
VTGRIAEWTTKLSEFELRFDRVHAIKSKALVDFINEWTPTPEEPREELSSLPGSEEPGRWTMYFDGSFGYHGAGAGVVIVSPTGEQLKYAVHLDFDDEEKCSNNVAEYEALLAVLHATAGLGIKRLVVRGDSQLVVNQIIKEYDCPQMWAYIDEVRRLERRFRGLQLEHIPRGENLVANELSKLTA